MSIFSFSRDVVFDNVFATSIRADNITGGGGGSSPITLTGDVAGTGTSTIPTTINSIQNIAISGAPLGANYVLASTGTSAATWQLITASFVNINSLSGYPLTVPHGGTGNTLFAGKSVILSNVGGTQFIEQQLFDGHLLIGVSSSLPVSATLTGTANQISVTNAPGSITLSTPQDIGLTSSVQFGNLSLSNINTQITLGAGSQKTILTTQVPSSTVTYTLPDVGINANFVMSQGAQTINGSKTFSSPIIGSVTGSSGSFTGSLSGDITGTQATTFISKIQGATLTGTPAEGTVINGTSGVAAVWTNALTLSSATNQLAIGSVANRLTLSSPATGTTRTYTIPDVGAVGTVAVGTNSPTVSGNILVATGTPGVATWQAPTFTGTVTSVGLSSSGIFTVSNSPITTAGTIILGVSGTQGGIPWFSTIANLASTGSLASGQLMIGGGVGAPSTLSVGADGNVVTLVGGAPVYGQVDLTSAAAVSGTLTVSNGGTGRSTLTQNGVLFGNVTSQVGITAAGSANSVLTSNGGAPSFSATPTVTSLTATSTLNNTATSNQIILGPALNQTTINTDGTSGPNRTYTIPNVTTGANFVMTEGVQTINGTKTFSSPISGSVTGSSGSFTGSLTGDVTGTQGATVVTSLGTAGSPVNTKASPQPAGAGYILNTTSGTTSVWTNTPTILSMTASSTSNQLVLGASPATITLDANPTASNRKITLPNVGADSIATVSSAAPTTGQLLVGVTGGPAVWTNQSSIPISGFGGLPLSIANGGTNSSTALNGNRIMVSSATAIVESGQLNNGQILIGSTGLAPVVANITGTTSQVNVTNGAGTITLSTPQNIAITSTPTFASETLTATSNQLHLGPALNQTTINTDGTAGGNRTYTIPSVSTGANFVMTEGAQTINGAKTFGTSPIVPGVDYKLGANTVTVTADAATAAYTLRLPPTVTSGDEVIVTDSPGGITATSRWAKLYPTFANYIEVVSTNPLPNQYVSIYDGIQAAIALGPAATTPVAVYIYPGEYAEPPLAAGNITVVVPQYVHLVGIDMQSVIVKPRTTGYNLFTMSNSTSIAFMTMRDVASPNNAMLFSDVGDYCLIHKVEMTNCSRAVACLAPSVDSYVYLEYVSCVGYASAEYTIYADASAFVLEISIENYFTFEHFDKAIWLTGTGCDLLAQAVVLQKGDLSGSGVYIENGAKFTTRSLYIDSFDIAINVPVDAFTPEVIVTGSIFTECNINLNILNTTTLGVFTSYSPYSKNIIANAAPFFISGKNKNIVTVAKSGGDFTSVSAAVAAITTASSGNRFIVSVGPGTYMEPTIVMKPYISVIGVDPLTCTIVLTSPTSTLFDFTDGTGAAPCTIYGMALTTVASMAGGKLINFQGEASGFGIFVQNISFGTCHTLINIGSALGESVIGIQNIFISSIGNFAYAFNITDNVGGTFPTRTIIQTIIWRPQTNPSFNTFILATSDYNSPPNKNVFVTVMNCALGRLNIGAIAAGNCLEVTNACQVTFADNTIGGFVTAISVPVSAITSPLLIINPITIQDNCTMDIVILDTGTTGTAFGVIARAKCNILSNLFSLLLNDPDDGIVLVGNIYQGSQFDRITNITDQIQHGATVGLVLIPTVTFTPASLDIDVGDGTGYLMVGTYPNDYLKFVEWTAQTVTATASATNWISVDNTGTVVLTPTRPSNITSIIIGSAKMNLTGLEIYKDAPRLVDNTPSQLDQALRSSIGSIFSSGCLGSAATAGGLKIQISSGNYWYSVQNFLPSASDPVGGLGPVPFLSYYTGSANAIAITDIPLDWDNSGLLTALTAGQWAKHAIYVSGEGAYQVFVLVYAQTTFASQVDAEVGSLPIPPSFISGPISAIIGMIVTFGDAGPLTDDRFRDIRPTLSFVANSSTATTDHNSLNNLTVGNAHPQYFRVDGTSTMTGDINVGNQDITNATSVGIKDTGSGFSVTLTPPTLVGNYNFVFPVNLGTLGQIMTSAGTGAAVTWQSTVSLGTPLATANTLMSRDASAATAVAYLDLNNGSNFISLKPPSSFSPNYILTLPITKPTAINQVLAGDTVGVNGPTKWLDSASAATASTICLRDGSGDASFNRLTANAVSNQLVLGTSGGPNFSSIITSPSGTLAANRTYTLPEVGSNTSFAYVGGTESQVISNKILTDGNAGSGLNGVVIANFADTNRRLKFDGSGATSLTTTTLTFSQTADRTITLPNATDTLVGKATTDVLTNKSLRDTSTLIIDNSIPSKELAFDVEGTTGTRTTLLTSQTASRTLTLPDITDTLVTKTTTDIMTNKTITASSNNVAANSLKTTGTSITVSGATNPGAANYALVTDSATTADWTTTPTFASQTLTDTTNQLVLGSTTISATPVVARTYTMHDAGNSANFVLDTAGALTITSTPTAGQVLTAVTGTTANWTTSTTGTVTNIATGTGLTGGPITTTGTISIANTGVTAATYNIANVTVNAQGQVTSIASASPVSTTSGAVVVWGNTGGSSLINSTVTISGNNLSLPTGIMTSRDIILTNSGGSTTVTLSTATSIGSNIAITIPDVSVTTTTPFLPLATSLPAAAGRILTSTGTDGAASWQVPANNGTVTSITLNVNGSFSSGIYGVTPASAITSSGTFNIALTGTSGGIPYFSTANILSSSAALTVNQLIVGGGVGGSPVTLAAVTNGNSLIVSGGIPTYGAVNLAGGSNSVSGILPVANGGTGVASLTSNAVLLGGATVGSVSGGVGTVLTGTAGAPVFSSTPTVTSATLSGTSNQLTLNVGGSTTIINSPNTGSTAFRTYNIPDISATVASTTNTGSFALYTNTPALNQVLTSTGTDGSATWQTLPATGTVTSITSGTGITLSPSTITTTGSVSLSNTAVTAGSYKLANITVDAQGRLTVASTGSPGTVTSGTVPRWANNTGDLFTTSGVSIDGSNNVTGVVDLTCTGNISGLSLKSTGATLILGSTNLLTITGTVAATKGYTIPDVNTGSTFVLTQNSGTSGYLLQSGGGDNATWVSRISININDFGSTPLSIANGGTNSTTALVGGRVMVSNGAGTAMVEQSMTNGQLFIGDTSTGDYVLNTLQAGTNIVVTNGAGTINVATSTTPTFNSATLSNTSNQLVLGTTNTTTISAVPSTNRTYTIPDVSSNATFALATNTPAIGQVLTATSITNGGAPTWATPTTGTVTSVGMTVPTFLSVTPASITSTGTFVVTLSGIALPVANGGTGLTSGTSGGILYFSGSAAISSSAALTVSQLIVGGGPGGSPVTLAAGTNGNSLIVTAGVPAYGAVNLAGGANSVSGVLPVANGGTGNNTFTSNGVLYGNSLSPTGPVLSSAAGTTGTVFIGTTGTAPSFSATPIVTSLTATATTNQLVLGTTNTTTISAAAPVASRTYTVPDVTTGANFVMTEGAQTVNGAKTFTSTITASATTNQLVLGTTNTTTISATAPAASRTYTVPDVSAAATFILATDTPAIGDVITATSATNGGAPVWSPPVTAANYAFAYNTTTLSIAGAAFQDVTFSTNGLLNGWTHTAAAAPFVCPQTGLYLISYRLQPNRGNGNATFSGRITVAAVEVAGSQAFSSSNAAAIDCPISNTCLANITSGQTLLVQWGCSVNNATNQLLAEGLGTITNASVTITRLA